MIGINASQAFSPNKGPALQFWLDSSDLGTLIASGNDLSDWNDKGSNSINFSQSTGANQPKTGINTINGKNVISFNGTSHFIKASLNLTLSMIFIVAKIESSFPNLSGLFASSFTGLHNIRMDGTNLQFRGNGNTNVDDLTDPSEEMRINGVVSVPPAIAVNTPFIISGVSGNPTGAFTPQIAEENFSRFWKGDVAEVFAYDVVPSSTFRIQAEQYLSNKWGIALA